MRKKVVCEFVCVLNAVLFGLLVCCYEMEPSSFKSPFKDCKFCRENWGMGRCWL